MITSIVIGVLLVALGAGGNAAWAGNGGCGNSCGGGGLFAHTKFVPNITYYAPYPYWFPNYFGPPYTDYQTIHYFHSPAESALLVKERILAINAGNPALLSLPKESLHYPKTDKNNVPERLP